MIVDALWELNNENGSDSATITRCIEGKYGARLKPRHAILVRAHLSLMKARGTVLSVASSCSHSSPR